MPIFTNIKQIDRESLDKIGYTWHIDEDGEYIVKDRLISITKDEAEAYFNATNELYEMYEAGAEYVIKNELFDKLNIPKNLVEIIKKSWISERENHLYGRFDLSGGIDYRPIKLIEFNADTPTLLLESSVVQWMILQNSTLTNKEQFNNIYESIAKKIKKIALQKNGTFSHLLFSSIKNVDEEIVTTKLLQKMANDIGLIANFSYLEDISFEDGLVFDEFGNSYDFFFKLYPWEEMDEYKKNLKTQMINPAYTLLYQSKGMLAILYKLFPESPYLLKTSFKPIQEKYVKKRMFGREGANIDIVENGKILKTTDGIYEEYQSIYQEYVEFIQDEQGMYYQAGVFYSDGACGLSFRRGAEILDDMSEFVGHVIRASFLGLNCKNGCLLF